jgi:hypothetical protein
VGHDSKTFMYHVSLATAAVVSLASALIKRQNSLLGNTELYIYAKAYITPYKYLELYHLQCRCKLHFLIVDIILNLLLCGS